MPYQETFYLLGSIYMILGIILMVILIGASIYIIIKVRELHQVVTEKTEKLVNDVKFMKEEITERPSIIVSFIGNMIAKGITRTFKSLKDKT